MFLPGARAAAANYGFSLFFLSPFFLAAPLRVLQLRRKKGTRARMDGRHGGTLAGNQEGGRSSGASPRVLQE